MCRKIMNRLIFPLHEKNYASLSKSNCKYFRWFRLIKELLCFSVVLIGLKKLWPIAIFDGCSKLVLPLTGYHCKNNVPFPTLHRSRRYIHGQNHQSILICNVNPSLDSSITCTRYCWNHYHYSSLSQIEYQINIEHVFIV